MCRTFGHFERTAKKRHRCEWCYERIEVGERYMAYSGVVCNGDFYAVKMHGECFEDSGRAAREEGGGCFEFSPGEGRRPFVANYAI
jgi:hypothetical protein